MTVFKELSTKRWKNKKGTGDRKCKCGSWKQHWKNFSGQTWPNTCTVSGCLNIATDGLHVFSSEVRFTSFKLMNIDAKICFIKDSSGRKPSKEKKVKSKKESKSTS